MSHNQTVSFSTYQIAIFGEIEHGTGNVVIKARAGTGKTFTILQGAKLTTKRGSALFLAFSKPIALENEKKLQGTGIQSKTVHACGMGGWRTYMKGKSFNVDSRGKKYSDMYDMWLKDVLAPTWKDMYDNVWPTDAERDILDECGPGDDVIRLLEMAQNNLWDPRTSSDKELSDIIAHYDLDVNSELESLICRLVRWMLGKGLNIHNVITFGDMLWLPILHKAPFKTYMTVFLDECQDLSPARLEIALRSVARGGRIVAVGDPAQSIFGFAGADTASFDNVIKRTNGKVMDLPVCYRCPTSHIELAQAIVPDIVARPGAPVGAIRHVAEGDLAHDVEGKQALVICRVNAPLVKHAYALIAKGRRVAIAGKDLGAGLKAVLRHVFGKKHKDTFTYSELRSKLEAYKSEQLVKLADKYQGKDLDGQTERLCDKVECLIAVADANPNANTLTKLRASIDDLFNCKDPDILLSSVHRAKGLEHENVYILSPERLGVPFGKRGKQGQPNRSQGQPWQAEQEKNLHYVALTRSMSELVFLTKSPKAEKAANSDNSEDQAKSA